MHTIVHNYAYISTYLSYMLLNFYSISRRVNSTEVSYFSLYWILIQDINNYSNEQLYAKVVHVAYFALCKAPPHTHWHMPGFLKLPLSRKSICMYACMHVCVCVCVCVCVYMCMCMHVAPAPSLLITIIMLIC